MGVVKESVSHDLRHQNSDFFDLVTTKSIPTENKILYLGLHALSSRPKQSCFNDGHISESIDEFLQLIDDPEHLGAFPRLKSALTEKGYRVRAYMLKAWRRKLRKRFLPKS